MGKDLGFLPTLTGTVSSSGPGRGSLLAACSGSCLHSIESSSYAGMWPLFTFCNDAKNFSIIAEVILICRGKSLKANIETKSTKFSEMVLQPRRYIMAKL